ncbi:MAG TPA: UDP-N-acetylmuramoyl-tripeptide--D-alanyl-D-alanine ligase, partial [Polyangiales bacterium]|nr:UDP-N-acetylmuramoyl-tripeptide--D-alanyl-D-alanine ligase [Polyangiales bacterium]
RGEPRPDGVPAIEVADTTRALGELAAFHRQRWGRAAASGGRANAGKVVAITGSAGKTTTKELTAGALAGLGLRVLKTAGNLNNQFGVPMTLFGLTEEHDIAVLEVGTSGPGEIAWLGAITKPDVAVVLLAALAHTEGLVSLEAVADEKASLWGALGAHGIAIVNDDDAELKKRWRTDVRTLSFGNQDGVTVRLEHAELNASGTQARINLAGLGAREVSLRLVGHAAATDAAAALAVVVALEGDVERAIVALGSVPPTPGRMALTQTRAGVTVCDDSYNANPRSMALGLETLKVLATGGRSVAVLADMKDLGRFSQAEHVRIGELAVRLGIDVLVGCGGEMAHATSAAARLSAGRLAPHPTRVAHVMLSSDAISIVQSLCRQGDVVLVKGSRAMAMETVADALTQRFGGSA